MPKLPTDPAAAHAAAEKAKADLAARQAKRQAAHAHNMEIIRAAANELRARQGMPPLAPDELVHAIICRRGRR